MLETIISGAALATFLKTPLDDLYKTSSGGVKKLFEKWANAGEVDKLISKVSDIGKVRTISSRQLIDLPSIYYPSKVSLDGVIISSSKIDDMLQASDRTSIVLTGTVGQGKSIFVRYLALQEVLQMKGLPVFIELRHAEKGKTLQKLIESQLIYLGFGGRVNDELVDHLFSRRLVALFLDGFDEVKREVVTDILDEIQCLQAKYPHLRILVSSRPTAISGFLDKLVGFARAELVPLKESDFKPFFDKIGVEEEARNRLLNAIKMSSLEVKKLITTPLMLTLVANSCGNRVNLPENLPDFFDALFGLMVTTHDESKPGYVRERSTSLSNSQFQGFFQAFCFVAKENCDAISMTPSQVSDCVSQSSSITGQKCSDKNFLKDITDVACLMVRDGLNYSFIHKSIREYFSAAFIKSIESEDIAKALYNAAGSNHLNWYQELKFLEQIDPFRFNKFVKIKWIEACLKAFDYKPKTKIGATKKNIIRVLTDLDPSLMPPDFGKGFGCRSDALKKIGAGWVIFSIINTIEPFLKEACPNGFYIDPTRPEVFDKITSTTRDSLKNLYDQKCLLELSLRSRDNALLSLIKKSEDPAKFNFNYD